jgi:hypothetical protein
MKNTWFQYRGYLIPVLLIAFPLAFLLVRGIISTNTQREDLTLQSMQEVSEIGEEVADQSISPVRKGTVPDLFQLESGLSPKSEEVQKELKDIKPPPLPPLQLDLRLAGTVISKEHSYALTVDETTGKQGLYRLGEKVKGVTLLKIERERVVIEKDGRTQVLRLTRGSSVEEAPSAIETGVGPPSMGASEGLPPFEPVFSETGPPVDKSIPVKELSHFEPVVSETGPPVDESIPTKALPPFEPVFSETGPPVDESILVKDLPSL